MESKPGRILPGRNPIGRNMDTAEIFIIIASSVGFIVGFGVAHYQCMRRSDKVINQLLISASPKELMELRKAFRMAKGIRGN